MGYPSTDEKNPGRRQVENYVVAGGLTSSKTDAASTPIEFRYLRNCLVDKRLGAVVKRPGSLTETIASSLGTPLGLGEWTTAASGMIPITRALLANFAGASFYQQYAGSWSAVTKTSRTSFSTSRQTQFTKLGSNLFIAGGRPAKWGGPGTTIDRVGIVPPTTAITVTSDIIMFEGGGIGTLASGAQYMYTYYNSSTGLESDWSPLSTSTGPKEVSGFWLSIPAATAQNWDKIRIYRTLDGGTTPYLVTTVDAGTTTYADMTPDSSLTTKAADQYDHAVPPDNLFIVSKFAQCLWWVDGSNPYKLIFSKPYIGSDSDLEYYPVDNYVMLNEPITGLYVVPGKMLIFHPRSISFVSGGSVDDFVLQAFVPGVGTVFPNSISSNGSDIVFLAEEGFVSMPYSGGVPKHISREIDIELQTFLAGSYNAALYISSCWNPSLRQFIFMLNAQSAAGAPWEEFGTGITSQAIAGWEDSVSLLADFWEDVANPSATDSMRVKFWGWSPELSDGQQHLWMEYTFPTITDSNVAGAYPLFVFHPQPSSDTADPQQDKTYLGLFDGTEGKIRTLFRRDRSLDDATVITSELITGRIAPGEKNGGYKLFQGIGFQNSYSDPTSDSLCTLKYLKDFDDPQLRSFSGSLITISGSTDIKKFPQMLAKHIHLYLTDTSQSQTKILLTEFFINYRERFRRESR